MEAVKQIEDPYLWRVVTSYFVAGVTTDAQGIIREAAPILAWAKGKHIRELKAWVGRKRGYVEGLG